MQDCRTTGRECRDNNAGHNNVELGQTKSQCDSKINVLNVVCPFVSLCVLTSTASPTAPMKMPFATPTGSNNQGRCEVLRCTATTKYLYSTPPTIKNFSKVKTTSLELLSPVAVTHVTPVQRTSYHAKSLMLLQCHFNRKKYLNSCRPTCFKTKLVNVKNLHLTELHGMGGVYQGQPPKTRLAQVRVKCVV